MLGLEGQHDSGRRDLARLSQSLRGILAIHRPASSFSVLTAPRYNVRSNVNNDVESNIGQNVGFNVKREIGMAIYTVGGIKGGSGKTTVATNLTVLLAMDGRDVLLVDADDQETATDFTVWRNKNVDGQAGYTAIQLSGDGVRTEIRRLAPKYDDIVIDTGGRDTTSQRAAMTVSDVYLVPFVPRSFDVWTLERVVRLIEEMRPANPTLRAFAFLNRADASGNDNAGAADYLKDAGCITYIDTPLGGRKAFSNAAAEGRAVTELKRKDTKAESEIRALYDFCRNVANNVSDNVMDGVGSNVGANVKKDVASHLKINVAAKESV